jgi:signal peptide peptidase-like protein 2B
MAVHNLWLWRTTIFGLSLISCQVNGDYNYGVLVADVAGSLEAPLKFCITYDPGFHRLPPKIYESERLPLGDLTSAKYENLCESSIGPPPGVSGSAVAALRGNCTFSEKARLVQSFGSRALLVVSPQLSSMSANSSTDYNEVNITVAMIAADNFRQIQNLRGNVSVLMFAPESSRADLNLLVIWVLAILTMAVGAFWSGRIKYQLWLNRIASLPGSGCRRSTDIEFSPLFVLLTVFMMCAMLLGLYFFYAYLGNRCI